VEISPASCLKELQRERHSGTRPQDYSFSRSIWNIDWSEHLPSVVTSDGILVEWTTFENITEFVNKHLSHIFEEDQNGSPFLKRPITATKAKYYRECADVFQFRDGSKVVGILVCTPIDWSTYYLRLAATLPEYHGRSLPQRFFPQLFDILKAAGVERVEAETSPSNLAVMHTMTRMRFNVTGTIFTERWGALVRLTRFLDEDCEKVFLEQFCTGIRYQVRGKSSI
jgi:RimJ/RimL family protein N-acetyltransferase